ncbi:probable beta-1,3-galactosyltransferase 2 isoform X1 [Tanacetum coccineum]
MHDPQTSATLGGILDRAIEAEDRKHGDFLTLLTIVDFNMKSYINIDDDVHVNIDCEWKDQARNICVSSFDWTCSGIGRPVDRIKEVHRRCGIAVEMMKQGATTTVLSFLLSVLVLPARLVALTDIIDNRQG